MKRKALVVFFMLLLFYLFSQYLSQTFGTSSGIFGSEPVPPPEFTARLPRADSVLSRNPRNIFEFRVNKPVITPVKVEPVRQVDKPEPVKETPKPVIRGNFAGLNLMGIRFAKGRRTAILEVNGRLIIASPGRKFSHFLLVSLNEKEAEIEDTDSGIRKRFILDI